MKRKKGYIYVSVYQQRLMGDDLAVEPKMIRRRKGGKIARVMTYIKCNMDTTLKEPSVKTNENIQDCFIPEIRIFPRETNKFKNEW